MFAICQRAHPWLYRARAAETLSLAASPKDSISILESAVSERVGAFDQMAADFGLGLYIEGSHRKVPRL